jgi:hypothetical protein
MGFEKKLSDLLNSMTGDEQTKARLDLNKFYQTRIETIRTRLWTTLTWLAAVQGAALVLTIKEAGLRTGPGPDLVLDQPILIFLLSGLAALLAYYMRQVVKGGVEHIQSNQKLSNIAVGLTPQSTPESVFNVMRRLAGFAIAVECVLGLIGILGILDWAGVDIPHIRIAAKT